jgi:hypothetical protein
MKEVRCANCGKKFFADKKNRFCSEECERQYIADTGNIIAAKRTKAFLVLKTVGILLLLVVLIVIVYNRIEK